MCVRSLCFFFKQKTAYEMRISDWSSDVCSSDLAGVGREDDAADTGIFVNADATDRIDVVEAKRRGERAECLLQRRRQGAGSQPQTIARSCASGVRQMAVGQRRAECGERKILQIEIGRAQV